MTATPNPLTSLARELRARFPRWRITEDAAELPGGSSFLDIGVEDRTAVVEWRPGRGFGVSAGPLEGYGAGPDELYATLEGVVKRLEDVLERAQRTVPLRELSLKRLRELRRITQEELALALEIQQASVSKLEARGDMRLSTLYKVVEALGGRLELVARFPEFEVKLQPPGESPPGEPAGTT